MNNMKDIIQQIVDNNHDIKNLLSSQNMMLSNMFSSLHKICGEEYRRGFNDGVITKSTISTCETEENIKIGDEVEFGINRNKGVVFKIDDKTCYGLTYFDGQMQPFTAFKKDCHKTGNHFYNLV